MSTLLRQIFCPDGCACLLCNEECADLEHEICPDCLAALRPCVQPAPPMHVDGLAAGFLYEGQVTDAVKGLKFRDTPVFASFLAAHMQIPPDWQVDVLLPVPLHPWRELWRGYNQSHLLAVHIARRTGLPLSPALLRRVRNTIPQSRLHGKERRANLKQAFAADVAVRGKSILLIDDVCTTGTTLSACAKALKKAGAFRVYALTATAAER